MRHLKGTPVHDCCPQEWRRVPNLTGSFELDAVIARNNNPDLRSRLEFYLDHTDNAYGPITGYSGYSNYSGDS